MALANRKARYEFYLKNNDTVNAEELLARYPDVKATVVKKEKAIKE
jgi:hypothetical protein|tara:strand:- start:124 stop:261 length:138 start_codon:yes stop_codon:yes gene_type:complete